MNHFHNQVQKRTTYLTLFKVLKHKSSSYASTFLLESEEIESQVDIVQSLLCEKKIEEISKMAFIWLSRNVKIINNNKWEQRISFLDKLRSFRHLPLKYKKKELQEQLTELWIEFIDSFIDQEAQLNAENSIRLIEILKDIRKMQPTISVLDNVISSFMMGNLNEDSKELHLAINKYYNCLESEMKNKQIHVSYGQDLILFLQSELLAKQSHNYYRAPPNPRRYYDWIVYQEYLHYKVTMQLCQYIKDLFGYDDTIIYKELKDNLSKLNKEDNPFWETTELINKAIKHERNQVKSVYTDKNQQDTINELHLLNQFVKNAYKNNNKMDKENEKKISEKGVER